LDVELIGPRSLQSFVMVHLAADLRPLVGAAPGVLYFVTDPGSGGTFISHGRDREWVYMHPWDPDQEAREQYTDEVCERLVRRAVAREDFSMTISTISTWTMTAQVAERYREGGVFLVGDSAHRFPPTGGLGLNTGVQDVHNLAWKLAAVEKQEAHAALLDTYESERLPVAQNNAEQSLQNAFLLIEVPQAMGLAAGSPEIAKSQFEAVLADPEARKHVTAAIDNQAEHFDMLGLQLGFSYDSGAVVGDGSAKPVIGNPVREYVPSSCPGSRMPHGWVTFEDRRVSTLDLIAPEGFTLFVGPDAALWVAAAGDPVRVLRIGRDVTDADHWWTSLAEMSSRGALLVRPDQHVAYRSREGVGDTRATLAEVIGRVLRRGAG
jgi:2,4-dichlorophenol 6-monooxygenase